MLEGTVNDPDAAAARERVVQAMERTAERYGLNRSCGRIYGILYFADDPRSLDDLATESGYAKSTVSTATRTLERLGLVRRRSRPETDRRAYFEAERDVRGVLADVLNSHADRELAELGRTLEAAQTVLETDEGEHTTDLDRVTELRAIVEEVGALATLLSRVPPDRLMDALKSATTSDDIQSPGFYPRWNQ